MAEMWKVEYERHGWRVVTQPATTISWSEPQPLFVSWSTPAGPITWDDITRSAMTEALPEVGRPIAVGPFDPPGGNYYSNPPPKPQPPTYFFWLGAEAEGFHARA